MGFEMCICANVIVCVYFQICVCVSVCVCVCVFVHTLRRVRVYVLLYVSVCVCLCVYLCVSMCKRCVCRSPSRFVPPLLLGRNHLGVPSGAIIAPGRASGALRRRGPFCPAAPPRHSDAPPPEKRSHSAPGPTTDRAITKTQLAPILAESGGGGDGVVDQSRARSGRMRSNGVGGAQVGGDRRRGAGTHQAAMDGERAPVVPGHLCHGGFD